MLNKKIYVLAIILLSLLTVSVVSATDSVDFDDVNNECVSIDNYNLLTVDENDTILDDMGTFRDLKDQINNVEDGGTLNLVRDYKSEGSGQISISKSITIDGQGHTIDANYMSRIFYIESAKDITLKNINFVNAKITGKYYGYGGAVYFGSNSNVVIDNSNFTNCINEYGAVYSGSNSNVVINNSNFINCSSVYGGAIMFGSYSTSKIINSSFINCSGDYGGAIAFNSNSNSSVSNSNFINNTAEIFGGGIATWGKCNISLFKICFIKNSAKNDAGGAVYTINSNLNASDVEISDCTSQFGGAFTLLETNSFISNSIFRRNTAIFDGGAIYVMYKSFTFINNTIDNNSAERGGGLYFSLTNLTLYDNNFTNNSASLGDAIYSISDIDKVYSGNIFIGNNDITHSYLYETINDNLTITNVDHIQVNYQNEYENYTNLPIYYNLADEGFVTPVKNQLSDGNCWAFSVLSSLESCILKATGLSFDFSESNIKNIMARYSNYGYWRQTNYGGYYWTQFGYLTSWLGPIYENDDSYYEEEVLSPLFNSIINVQNILFLKRTNYTDNDDIKNAILRYGAVSTNMYYNSAYLNNSLSYYYNGTYPYINHAVCIVGWDDNYSRYNFKDVPDNDGAWIVKNSWGDSWGDLGYFYVSYYDKLFAMGTTISFTFILNDTINFNRVYQLEIMPDRNYNPHTNETVFKNIFHVGGDEYLAAVSSYFADECSYNIHVYINDILKLSKSGRTKAGYYTFDLEDFIFLNKGDNVTILFNCTDFSTGSGKIFYSSTGSNNDLLIQKGVSFFWNGYEWEDFYSWRGVACIKMFTTFLNEKKANPYFQITSEGDDYDNSFLIDIILPDDATGLISINCDDKDYIINLSTSRSIRLYGLNENNNTLLIKYGGDDKYLDKILSYVVDTYISKIGTFEELSKKIDSAKKGDVITLTKDYFYVSGSTDGIEVKKSITIDGQGHTISGNYLSRIFKIYAKNVILKNINIIGGRYSGAIYWDGDNGFLSNCTFVNNSDSKSVYWNADNGVLVNCSFVSNCEGAVYWSGDNGVLVDCSFVNNSDYYEGAVYWTGNSGLLANCSFVNNSATWYGGAIRWCGVNGTVFSSCFVNNSAEDGGAVYWLGVGGFLVNCSFYNNQVPWYGGAVYWLGADGFLVNCSFNNNHASRHGGAINWNSINGTLIDCSFSDNFVVNSRYNGGAIYGYGDLFEIINCSFVNNYVSTLSFGGAIYLSGNNFKLSRSYFINNFAYNNGGAIHITGEKAILTDCICVNNSVSSSKEGGAIYLSSNYSIINNCSFINNSAYGGSALSLYGNNTMLNNCSFVNNFAIGAGAAIYLNGGYCQLSNSYFVNNNASILAGAIFSVNNNNNIFNCSFTNNSAPNGGAIILNGKNNILSDCIFEENRASELGGAIYMQNIGCTLKYCSFINNAAEKGGAIFWTGNDGLLENCIFTDNIASKNGSAVYWYGDMGILSNSTFIDNLNTNQIYWWNTESGTIADCRFINNTNCVINNGANFIKRSVSLTSSNYIFDYKNQSIVSVQLTDVLDNLPIYSNITLYFDNGKDNEIFIVGLNNNVVSLYNELFDLNSGNWTVNAIFEGDDNYYPSNTLFTVCINPIKSSIILELPLAIINQESTLIAKIGNDNNFTINDGVVIFYDGEIFIGNSTVKNNNANLNYVPTTEGEHIISAVYTGNNYLSSSVLGKLLVDSTSVEILADSGFVGFNTTFVASVKGIYSTINKGTVSFYVDENFIGKSSVVNGVSCLNYTPLLAGNFTVKAFYGENNNSSNVESSTSYIVNPADSQIIINDYYGTVMHEILLSLSVVSSNNLVINDGTVTFMDNGNIIGSSDVNEGVASLYYIPTTDGEHIITTIYTGNNYLTSNGSAKLLVDSANVKIVVDNGIVGFNTMFVANVNGFYSIINEGTVTFYVDDKYIDKVKVVNGSASLTYNPLLSGNFSVKVVYGESDRFSNVGSSTSYIVDPADSRIIINNVSGIVFNELALYSTVASSNNLVINEGVVTFIEDGNYIGMANVINGVATLYYTPNTVGEHLISVVYSSNNYLSSHSSINLVVKQATSRIFINNVSGTVFHEITLSSNVVSFNNFVINEGNVTFMDNGNVIGVSDVVNGVASLSYTPTTLGEHIISTTYIGTNFLSSFNALTILIDKVNTQLISFDVNTVYNGDKYLFVTLKDYQGNPIMGSTISINLNGVKKLTTNANGQVKLTTNALAPKTYITTITFEGDDNYVGSSTTVKVIVKKATPKLTAKKATFKVKTKTKKYAVTLKGNDNKVMKNAWVILKVNKKTYKVKTNSKGQATFKITNLKKKATFKATVTYAGNSCYNKVTKTVKITCK